MTSTSKSTGSYYTPKKLAEFILTHVLKNIENKAGLRVLEPSCGDGVFLRAFIDLSMKEKVIVDAIDKDAKAINLAKINTSKETRNTKINVVKNDFLKIKSPGEYDIVIGNPPYINRKLMSKGQLYACAKIHESGGLADKSIRNIWPAFVVKSSLLLSKKGVLAFVLPGELLQVGYAKEIRDYLEKQFQAVEILVFEDLVFPALGQDVVVVFAYKSSRLSGIRYSKIKNVESLNGSIEFSERKISPITKWSGFILEDTDINFLSEISNKVMHVSQYCTSTPGIVTGANSFFIVNKDTVDKYKLQNYLKPILQKSSFVGNNVRFSASHLEKLQQAGDPSFLLDLGSIPYKKLSSEIKSYLRLGQKNNVHKGYKCKNRKPWYNIPVVWAPIGVVFKRSHLYPRLIRNDANALVTDTAYRIIPNKDSNIESIIYSFYNSLTLIFCELNGRYYGGGVLELTPSEFKSLPLPYKNITKKDFLLFSSKFVESNSINDLIDENDNILLSEMNLERSDITRLQEIRRKMLAHRLRTTLD